MDERDRDRVSAFDTLFTTNHIQMCKVLMVYLDPPARRTMAVYIKLAELSYTLSFLKKHPFAALSEDACRPKPDIGKICEEVKPYLSPAEQGRLRSVMNTMQSFRNLQDMMEMMQMMQELFPEGGQGGADLLSGLAGLAGMGGSSGSSGTGEASGSFGTGGSSGETAAQGGGLDMVSLLQMLQGLQSPKPPSGPGTEPP